MKKNMSLLLVWAGQIVSLFGSGLTGFALGVWLYERTGSASIFALVAICSVLPQLVLSPLAGVWVDRYNRRWMMALADSGAALCSLAVAGLFFSGTIQVWHIYLATALSAACGALQMPAYSALVATTIPQEQLARANGLIQLGQGLAEILAPALAGVLLAAVGVPGVLLIDLATYGVGVTTLLVSRIPAAPAVAPRAEPWAEPLAAPQERAARADFWTEARAGLLALRSSRGLLALLAYQAVFSFLWSLFAVLVRPMVLGFTTPEGLGAALTVAGAGMLTGSLVLSAWGGPKRRLRGLLAFELTSAFAFVLMGLRPNLLLVAGAAFLAHFTLAFVSGLNEALWQGQTPRDVQGRVFALKQAVVKGVTLLAYALAGVLGDRVLQPLLLAGGALSGSLGGLVGVGPGRGIAALFIVIGLVKAAAALGLASSPAAKGGEAPAGHPAVSREPGI